MVRVAFDKHISPVGWYFSSYLLRFVELHDGAKNDLSKKFLSWENTVLVQAKSLDQAYEKVEKIGKAFSKPYRGGPNGVHVKWEYLGVTVLLPVYEKIADGAEIAWAQRRKSLRTLRESVRSKRELLK